jgi:hypothetical protein
LLPALPQIQERRKGRRGRQTEAGRENRAGDSDAQDTLRQGSISSELGGQSVIVPGGTPTGRESHD